MANLLVSDSSAASISMANFTFSRSALGLLSMVTGLSGQFYLSTIPAYSRIAAHSVPLYLPLNSGI